MVQRKENKAKRIKKVKKEAVSRERIRVIREEKPELEVKKEEVREFVESSLPDSKRGSAPVLESGQEQPATNDLEDFLEGVETPQKKGKEEKEGPSYSVSKPSYLTGEESQSGIIEERDFDEVLERLRGRKIVIDEPTILSPSKGLSHLETRDLKPVESQELSLAGVSASDEYLLKYAKPHDKGVRITHLRKDNADIKKYKKAR